MDNLNMDLNFRIYSFELRILETFTDSLKTIPVFFLDIKIILLTLFVCHLYMFASLVTVGHTKVSKWLFQWTKKSEKELTSFSSTLIFSDKTFSVLIVQCLLFFSNSKLIFEIISFVVEMLPRALHLLGKNFTSDLHSVPDPC